MGAAYYQDSQMVFSPIESATGTPQIDPQAQVEGKVLDVQPISTVATTQIPPVYTNSTPMAMYAQGELHVRIPSWLESNYWTWYASGIHDSISIKATKYIGFLADESARQCVGSTADPTSRYCTNVTTSGYTNVSTFSSKPNNVSALWPTPQQLYLAMML